MSNALIVEDVYKQFGKPGQPFWKRILQSRSSVIQIGDAPNEKLPEPAIAVEENGKQPARKRVIAVDHVSFQVKEGEIFGVLGPNGGGKSTLIRLICTLLLPDAGTIRVFGYDVVRNSMEARRLINRVSVEASFFKKLSSIENLSFYLRLYGMNGKEINHQVVETLARLGLEKQAIYKPMEELSRGMQQKVAVSRALLTRPRLLLLDEPTTGLDPRSKREVQDLVQELRDKYGTTILLTTHDMLEAEKLCNRIAIMDKGRVVALDTPENLRKRVPQANGHPPSMEDVFLELTGKKLLAEEEIGV
jgi:ABC-2 type transport system ATP-binding protein